MGKQVRRISDRSGRGARGVGEGDETDGRGSRPQAAARESVVVAHPGNARFGNIEESSLSCQPGGRIEAFGRQARCAEVMLRFLCLAILAGSAMAQQLHIDHVTVAGKNVEAMRKALETAGIPTEYGGPHSNHATEMALASFPDGSYLELIAIQPKPA